MSTLLSALETQARRHLLETTARFWTSAEIVDILNLGVHDLWRGVNDLKLDHFLTRDTTNVTFAANATTLSGVPSDCVRVRQLEVRDLSDTGTSHNWSFTPLLYSDPKFQSARSLSAQSSSGSGQIYWHQAGAGGPVSAPVVYASPLVDTTINLSLTYVPTLAALTASSANPIPGESDNALICWAVAFARAKERDDRAPDPTWLALYATEKQNLLKSLAPRQNQEAEAVNAIFEYYWG